MPASQSRLADILLPTWCHGRPAALDIHVISLLQQLTLDEAASTPGHALQVGTQRKLAAHLSECRSGRLCTCQNADLVDFVPVVAETLGSLSDEAIHIVRAFRKAIARRANLLDFSTSTHHLFHRLAISPWLGNASLWLHRLPSLLPSVDGVI